MSTEGYADIIRVALQASDGQLTLDQIIAEAVGPVDRKGMSTILRQRVVAGEIIRHHNPTGVLTYSLNPEHKLRVATRPGAIRPAPIKRSTVPVVVKPAPMPATPATPPASRAPEPKAAAADAPPPAAAQNAAPAASAATRSPDLLEVIERMPPVADRFALRDRLYAIAQDVQDALDDACAAELPHSLIRHLVAANGAAHRALLALPA